MTWDKALKCLYDENVPVGRKAWVADRFVTVAEVDTRIKYNVPVSYDNGHTRITNRRMDFEVKATAYSQLMIEGTDIVANDWLPTEEDKSADDWSVFTVVSSAP